MDKLELIDLTLYEFDSEKGIYSKYKKKWCAGYTNKYGYKTIRLKTTDGTIKSFQYHRVLMYVLKPIPDELKDIPLEKLQIDHIDTNKSNNNLSNLRWGTPKMNGNNPITLQHKSATLKGRIITDEWKKKMSKGRKKFFANGGETWNKGKKLPQISGKKNPFFGKKHSEESKKKMSQSHKGTLNNATSKTLYQYDKNKNCLNIYPSVRECCRQNGWNYSAGTAISECCNGKQKTSNGYIWSYNPL